VKIVHVIASIDPKFGGPQAVVQRIAAAQCALGHEVHVISYANADAQKKTFEMGRDIPNFADIRWHILPEPDVGEKLLCREGRKLVRAAMPSASFLHLHGVWDPILLHAANVARKFRVPYCLCTSGMLDSWSMGQKSLKKQLAFLLGYRRMLNKAKFLHALNLDEVQLMKPLGLRSPSVIIPNGVFPTEFDSLPEKGRFRRQIGLPEGRRYILFLSRLHFKKGLDILARAFQLVAESHPDVDLVVAGPPDGAEEPFRLLVKEFGLESRVHVVGPIYGESKIAALVDAACFCLPSRQEGFSIAITEALACATPVVITDACHFPEVRASEAGFVVSIDPAAVALGLADMLDNPILGKSMGANGRRLVMERFTWPAIADLTIKSYGFAA
jgi:glycosyltransferase involved in cell wall biosynthesis